jgi:hypothetical protein
MKVEEVWDEPAQDISAMTAVYWQIARYFSNDCCVLADIKIFQL